MEEKVLYIFLLQSHCYFIRSWLGEDEVLAKYVCSWAFENCHTCA
jgi:hypothetical protein